MVCWLTETTGGARREWWLPIASGTELEALAEESNTWYYAPRLSPNGRRVVVTHYEPGTTGGGLWLHELEGNIETRLTFSTGDDSLAAWSPDGREVAFSSIGSTTGTSGIFRIAVERSGQGQAAFTSATFVSPDNWTPDGRRLVYWEAGVQGGGSLWIRSLEGDPNPRRLGQEHATEWSSDLSSGRPLDCLYLGRGEALGGLCTGPGQRDR